MFIYSYLIIHIHLQRLEHGGCEHVRVVLAGEVEAVDLLVVPPLVEGGRGLVVLQPLQDGAVDHHLHTPALTSLLLRNSSLPEHQHFRLNIFN